MTWTPTTFRARWPEFDGVADNVVSAALADAARGVDARLFGTRTDLAVGLRAAHLLAISPYGQQARLESDKSDTTYRAEYLRMAREVAGGPWVMGQTPDSLTGALSWPCTWPYP